MHGSFFKGVVLGAIVAAVVSVAGTALATAYIPFYLNKDNTAPNTVELTGSMSNEVLHVSNTGNGAALRLSTQSFAPPFYVNSAVKVASLNADFLDGRHAGQLDVDKVDGKHAEDLIQGEGDVVAKSSILALRRYDDWGVFTLPGKLGQLYWRLSGWSEPGFPPADPTGLEVYFQNGAGHDMKVWTGWSDWPCIWFDAGQLKVIGRTVYGDIMNRDLVLAGGGAITTVHFAAQALGDYSPDIQTWQVAVQATVSDL